MDFDLHYGDESNYLAVSNKGFGPLLFSSFTITFEKREYKSADKLFREIINKVQKKYPSHFDLKHEWIYRMDKIILLPKEEKYLLKWTNKGDKKVNDLIVQELIKTRFHYEYKDVYNNSKTDSYWIADAIV